MFAVPAFSTGFAIVVSHTADYGFSYGKTLIIIIIITYIITYINILGPLQSLYQWANQIQIVLVRSFTFLNSFSVRVFSRCFCTLFPIGFPIQYSKCSSCLRNLGKYVLNQ